MKYENYHLFYFRVLDSDGNDFYGQKKLFCTLLLPDSFIIHFLKEVHSTNPEDIGKFSLNRLNVYKNIHDFEKRNEGVEPLETHVSIKGIGSTEDPVILAVPKLLQQEHFWKAIGYVRGTRKSKYFYQLTQNHLGFYEKRQVGTHKPFSYDDNGQLNIIVFFESKDNALHFRAEVLESVSTISWTESQAEMSVEPIFGIELDDTILISHYDPDEDSPPHEIIELCDTSYIFKYQRLEDEKWFFKCWKARRAHLIDRYDCEKGRQFEKYHTNENNYLALSNDAHCWFETLHNVPDGIPFFNLEIKAVAQTPDPAYDFRYRVDLLLHAFDAECNDFVLPKAEKGFGSQRLGCRNVCSCTESG